MISMSIKSLHPSSVAAVFATEIVWQRHIIAAYRLLLLLLLLLLLFLA